MGFFLMGSSNGVTIATPQWDWGETKRTQSPCPIARQSLHTLLSPSFT